MATYVLIHGAGDSAFHWHLLEPELRARGQEAILFEAIGEAYRVEVGLL